MRLYFFYLFAIASATASGADPAPRPNILYFYVDDMGWGSIGPNGQAERKAKGLPYVRTPNIDQLAARGINFTRGYGCHVCSPARSSQQSGFHQGHTFADRNDPNNAKKAMRSDDILMGDALSAAGYTTGYWGKWGYGGSANMASPTIDNVQTLPTSHGYQFALTELHHVRAHTFFQPTLWSAPAKGGAKGGLELIPNTMAGYAGDDAYPNSPANQNHPDYPKTGYCDDAYAFAALDFVRTNAKAYQQEGKPFFGLLAVQIPHAPFDEISKLPLWNEAYRDDKHFAQLPAQAQQWAAMVTRIDAHFGNILAALDDPDGDGDTSDSVAGNTLVIFQSDNGGPGGANNSAFDANGGLRGTKGSIHEGGIRVPLVMRWPERIGAKSKLKAGSNCDRVVDVTDLLPTFCELAGTTTPLGIDGVSIAPLLSGEGHQCRRAFIIHEAGNGQSIIRGKDKLVRGAGAAEDEGKKKRKKKKEGAAGFSLYDLNADHAEANNLAAAHPELVKELKALLLGERVTEPRGFANTYHQWTGESGGSTSNPDHWSDYEYANAGITYLTDDGAPRLSWTAHVENKSGAPSVAKADADLEFLGLGISGGSAKATQALVLEPKVNLTGRNEIRISNHGKLYVDGGTVSSQRWIDILPGGTLDGTGTIEATVYNRGSVSVSGTDHPHFKIGGAYRQSAEGALDLFLNSNESPALEVEGDAKLDGVLNAVFAKGFKPVTGTSYPVLTADQITGTFANPDSEIVTPDGSRFTIRYSKSTVTLEMR